MDKKYNTANVSAGLCKPGDKILHQGMIVEIDRIEKHGNQSFLISKLYDKRELRIEFYKGQIKVDKIIS